MEVPAVADDKRNARRLSVGKTWDNYAKQYDD
jgi:hypothetical protein